MRWRRKGGLWQEKCVMRVKGEEWIREERKGRIRKGVMRKRE